MIHDFLEFIATEKGLSLNSREAYQRDLEQYLEFCIRKAQDPLLADTRFLRTYLADLRRREIAPRTMARKVSVLKGYYRFLVRENAISQDPTELITVLVKEKKLPKHLSVKEVFQFLHSMSGHNEQSVRDRALFEFWYATGCRVSELTTLAADSVDLSDGLVKVLGKGNRERWIPLNRVAVEWLTKYKDVRHRWLQKLGTAASPIFFLSQRGLPLTRQGMWRLLKTRAQEAGIERAVWPHLIRHTFATHVLRGGADLRSVQELLGHRSIAATEIYTHLSVENLKDMQRKYHPRG